MCVYNVPLAIKEGQKFIYYLITHAQGVTLFPDIPLRVSEIKEYL
jgi:hypothetical protein